MRKVLAVALMAICGATPVWAEPSHWVVDAAQSTLSFTAQQGDTVFQGGFKKFTPEIVFDPQDLARSHITVKVATASAFAGSAERDEALPAAEWFNVQQFPQAQFETTAIKSVGSDKTGLENYVAVGDLTIRGMSKKIILPFWLKAEGKAMRAKGEVVILRQDFGVGQGEYANDSWIKYEVKVGIDIVATKSP